MSPPSARRRRFGSTLATFVIGLPLAAAVVGLFHFGPLHHLTISRYLEYPVQWAEVTLFCCALAGLMIKLAGLYMERRAFRSEILPRWDGKPIPVDQAPALMASLDRQPERIHDTHLGLRVRAVLDFICQRRAVTDLDDQLRALADNDAIAHDNSYALIRLITWAMPILGFLGTVLGITGAIGGVTPEVLEQSLSQVTGGLAEAFDATAVALSLTMATMFLTSLVERQEQALLDMVDQFVDRCLAHRWRRDPLDATPVLAVVQRSTDALTAAVEGIVGKQAEVWANTLAEPERRAVQVQERMLEQLLLGLQQALEQTLQTHAQRLAAMENQSVQATAQLMQQLANLAMAVRDTSREQVTAIVQLAESVTGQARVLGKLQEGEANLIRLEEALQQNLATLAGVTAFEDALHSVTAAVHLLTTRTGGAPVLRLHGNAA